MREIIRAQVGGLRGPGLTDADKAIFTEAKESVQLSEAAAAGSATASGLSAESARSSAELARAAVAVAYSTETNGRGLLYKSDGTLNGWTGDTSAWTSVLKPALLTYGPSPVIAQTPGPFGSSDAGGNRETFLFIDTDGTWYEFYGAGNGSGLASDPLSPWRPQYSRSTDGGVTWTKLGDVPGISRNHGYDDGQWPAADNLFLDHRDGTYYLHRLTAGSVYQNEVCSGPYTSDVWSASNINGPYTYVRNTVTTGPAGSFDANDAYASCIVFSAGNYYLFYSAVSNGPNNQWHIGLAVGSSPAGPFTKTGSQVLPDTIRGQAENPEVFFSKELNCWV
ncbi:hypothetical protein, partial [Sphingomonas sp. ACRSK]|uniref:hypothetical protein n=1 Tax=Sphingomonas sp. ACRSK TaxID=2918213 RepID=UPI001EF4DCA6